MTIPLIHIPRYRCPFNKGKRWYKSVHSLRCHISYKYSDKRKKTASEELELISLDALNDQLNLMDNIGASYNFLAVAPGHSRFDQSHTHGPILFEEGSSVNQANSESSSDTVKKTIKIMLLKMRTKYYASEKCTEFVIRELGELLSKCRLEVASNLLDITQSETVGIQNDCASNSSSIIY